MISTFSIVQFLRHWRQHFFGKESYVVNHKHYRFAVRPWTHDLYTLDTVVVQDAYRPSIDATHREFRTILDLGANIGSFSIWAASNFAPERVVAVELEPGNYQQLLHNLRLNGLTEKVTAINAAIYDREAVVGIKTPLGKGSIDRLDERGSGTRVNSVTLKDLLAKYGIQTVDYLKLDIEGSERFVLIEENADLFRSRVRYVHLEAHRLLGYKPKQAVKYFADLGFKTRSWAELHTVETIMVEAANPRL
jgi:FkbM family methyltransferase